LSERIITITSDFGTKDYYSAAISGRLLSGISGASIVTVSNQITQYSIHEAAFNLRNAWAYFPEGTIHLALVNRNHNSEMQYAIIRHHNHYFIGPDNGIFGLLFDEQPELMLHLDAPETVSPTFRELDICTHAAIRIAAGDDILSLGTQVKALTESTPFRPVTENKVIKGMVVYLDNYHNAITNINRKIFSEMHSGGKYVVRFGKYYTERIAESYANVPEGEIIATFGSSGMLEIAMKESSARNLMGIRVNDIVRIEFE
jgi:hypothetical protein